MTQQDSAPTQPAQPTGPTRRTGSRLLRRYQRTHYAWVIVAASFFGLLAAQGARLSFGAFLAPWEQEFATSRGGISLISTVSFLVYGFTQPLAGRLVDRIGTRVVLSGSAVLVGVSLALAAYARSPLQLAIAYGLLASVGFGGVSQVVASVAVTEWFTTRRGLVFAVIEAAYGAGQFLLVPGSLLLIDVAGWRTALTVLAALSALLAAPVLWLLIRSRPAELGLRPYGAAPPCEVDPGDPAAASDAEPAQGRVCELLASRGFWGLAVPFFICGFTTTGMIDTHLIPYAHDHGHSTAVTGAAVSLLAAFNVLGTLASGPLSDRLDSRRILAGLYAGRALTLLLLLVTDSPTWLLTFGVLFGLVDFATVAPTQVLASAYFRRHSLGLVFGLIFLSHQLGSAVGAYVPGALYDLTGSYDLALLIGAVALLVAAALSLTLPPAPTPQVNQPAATEPLTR